ncbi:pyridoxal-phosphate dependent enzyme [bacterium]|nr:MAG: pyridoxal-phosphate dependent enzyme [bacterium]
MDLPNINDISEAADRIAGGVVRTRCHYSGALSDITGCRVWVKPEYRQRTGSFKERGARNALLRLPAGTEGVIAASAGNHALALAWHARDLGIPVTVVMPRFAPMAKQGRCREYGARVLLHGDDIQQAKILADELVESERLTYVHGFDGFDVIAGQGTIGLEIADDVPTADAVIVPIGGAGLIAGVGLAIKERLPSCRVVGVEPSHAASFRDA